MEGNNVMSNLIKHAENELRLAGLFDKDSDYGGMIGEAVLNMVKQFSEEGHSGFSAQMAIKLFEKVANFEPITPLTGEANEWLEYMDGHYQNIRCSHVFKDGKDEKAYDSKGKIFYDWFVNEDGERVKSCFTCQDSRVPVTFPYVPTRVYEERPAKQGE